MFGSHATDVIFEVGGRSGLFLSHHLGARGVRRFYLPPFLRSTARKAAGAALLLPQS